MMSIVQQLEAARNSLSWAQRIKRHVIDRPEDSTSTPAWTHANTRRRQIADEKDARVLALISNGITKTGQIKARCSDMTSGGVNTCLLRLRQQGRIIQVRNGEYGIPRVGQ